jgi:hypothetical protein
MEGEASEHSTRGAVRAHLSSPPKMSRPAVWSMLALSRSSTIMRAATWSGQSGWRGGEKE